MPGLILGQRQAAASSVRTMTHTSTPELEVLKVS